MWEGTIYFSGGNNPNRLIPGLEIEDKHGKVNRKQETN